MTVTVAPPADFTPAAEPSGLVARKEPSAIHRHTRSTRQPVYLLAMAGVHKSFSAGVAGCTARVRVLVDVSLRVNPGEVVGVTGGAGAGKTTLLLCAAGLLRPDLGSVAWLGASTSDDQPTGGRPPWHHFLRGALRLQDVERALAAGARLLLLDHAAPVSLLLDRGALGRALARHAAALVIASRDRLTLARTASRILAIRDGRLQVIDRLGAPLAEYQRKRSAARASSELPSALARSRIRSTCGRSFRSPQ